MSAKGDLKRLLSQLEDQGARLKRTEKGVMVLPPDKTKPAVLLHYTTSDHRALRNARSRLRQSGFDV